MILQRTKSNSLTSISVKPTTRSVRSKRKRRRRNEHRNIYIKHSHTARNDSLLRVRTVLRGGTFSLQLSGVPLLLRQTSEGCKRPRRSCGTFKKLSPRRIVAPQKEITPCAPHSHFSLSPAKRPTARQGVPIWKRVAGLRSWNRRRMENVCARCGE